MWYRCWCEAAGSEIIQDLTAHHIRRYLVELHRRNLSSQYQHDLARAIRAFLNYCVRDELLEKSPFDKVQMPRLEKKILEAFSTEEIHRLLKGCTRERDRTLCLFLLDTGLRASELIALNVEDVDIRTGMVTVRLGKGQKGRTTYVGARTRKQLRRYFAERGDPKGRAPAFTSERGGKRLTLSELIQIMARLQKSSGVGTCTCHTFRRTFAIQCLRNGMNVYILARLMGHADITILQQYLALVEEDLQDAHAKYSAVDNLLA